MAITIMPRDYNPWVQALPNFLGNMALQKISQNFRGQLEKENRDIRVGERTTDREQKLADLESSREFTTDERIAGQGFKTSERIAGQKPGKVIHLKLDNAQGKPIYLAVRPNADGSFTEIGRGTRFKPGATINVGSEGVVDDPVQAGGTSGGTVDYEKAASEGTGLWANLGAALDSVGGGLGIDKLFGQDGFFKNTQDARQQLRILKQLGKSALMNSSKGPVWEQKMTAELYPDINSLFVNPRTEARKIGKLRVILKQERAYKVRALKTTTDKILARQLRTSITDIDRIRTMIGGGTPGPSDKKPLSPEAQKWLKDKGY